MTRFATAFLIVLALGTVLRAEEQRSCDQLTEEQKKTMPCTMAKAISGLMNQALGAPEGRNEMITDAMIEEGTRVATSVAAPLSGSVNKLTDEALND